MLDKNNEVFFGEYCKTCKYKNYSETDCPCSECIAEPVNLYSHKPIRWEGADGVFSGPPPRPDHAYQRAVKYVPERRKDKEKAIARQNIDAEYAGNKVQSISDSVTDDQYPSTTAVKKALESKIDAPQVAQIGEVLTVEEVDADGKPKKWKTAPGVNITTELTQESTDAQVPSAKAAYDAIQNATDKDAVRFVAQELTEEQKEQARKNINATPKLYYWPKEKIASAVVSEYQTSDHKWRKRFEYNNVLLSLPADSNIFLCGDYQVTIIKTETNGHSQFNIDTGNSIKVEKAEFKNYFGYLYFVTMVLTAEEAYGSQLQNLYASATGMTIDPVLIGMAADSEGKPGLIKTWAREYDSIVFNPLVLDKNGYGMSYNEFSITTASDVGFIFRTRKAKAILVTDEIPVFLEVGFNPPYFMTQLSTNFYDGEITNNYMVMSPMGMFFAQGEMNIRGTSNTVFWTYDSSQLGMSLPLIGEAFNTLSANTLRSPTTAQVGQIVKVKAVDESGKITETETVDLPQADWNQNDSTQPDYVKNRPFYTGDPVETVLVEERTESFANDGDLHVAEFPSTFEATVGEIYKVSWDGTVYECTCVDIGDRYAIGNLSIVGVGSDTGEPFFMGILNGDGIVILTADTSASHTFSISSGTGAPEVVKIDKKYLVQPDWNQNDETAADYVKNRTHWVKYGLDVAGFTITLPISADETMHDDIPFEVGQTWSVVSNKNVSYNCTVEKADDGTVYIGVYPSPGYNTTPFYVSTTKVMGDSMWVGRDGNTSITLTCLSNADIYHTIPFEYFPDAIFSQESSPVKFGTDDSGNIIKTASVQGNETKASKECSHAEGNSTIASGYCSHAEGDNAKASGDYSHAEGEYAKASGYCSHAGGYYTEASGKYSHAEGQNTIASGYCSHAEGYRTKASGKYSHAEGYRTKASGDYSHAEGYETVAKNAKQTVCGAYNKYNGDNYSYKQTTKALYTKSTNQYSAADSFEFDSENGVFTLINPTTYAYNTIPIGKYVINNGNMYKILSIESTSSTSSKYNTQNFSSVSIATIIGKYIRIVGNGTSNTARSNAYTLDWNGVPWFQGRPQFGGTEQDDGSQTVMANGDSEIILSSPSGKKFSVKVDDSGTLSATEVV